MGISDERLLEDARKNRDQGRLDAAAGLYERFLQVHPDHVDALIALTDVLEGLNRLSDAATVLSQAIGRQPDQALLHGRFADVLHAQGDRPGAIEGYRRALAIDPALTSAWWGLGCALAVLGDHTDATDAFRRLIGLQAGNGMACLNLGKSLFELGQVDEALRWFHTAVDLLPEELRALPLGNIATVIPGSSAASDQDILQARQRWAACCLTTTAPGRRSSSRRGRHDPIRLGYVSAFFDKRNWMKPVWGLINNHDRQRFEIHLFSDRPEAAIGPCYRRDDRDHFHDVSRLGNPAVASRIEELEIDLLVDLNGYSRPARLPLFASRPAPVQVAWFNMFATSGIEAFDYLIGDRHVILPGEEASYSERVIRLPGSYLTFEVGYPVPDVVEPPCLRRGALTFGCLAPQYKITPEVVESWCRILRATPSTRLLLKSVILEKPSAHDFVRGQFKRFSVPADRLVLEGPAEHHAFLAKYGEIDIALDTFPYNGGTTTMEAIWQGVPVLTFAGDRWAGRISESLLREANLGEFVAPDAQGFVEQGIELATDTATPGRLQDLRRTMRDRLRESAVRQVRTFARDMEDTYLAMLQSDHS